MRKLLLLRNFAICTNHFGNFAICTNNFWQILLGAMRKNAEYCVKVVPLHSQQIFSVKYHKFCAKQIVILRKPYYQQTNTKKKKFPKMTLNDFKLVKKW